MGGNTTSILVILMYILVFGAIIYFLIIRPQRKKQKQKEKMRNSLEVGDEIITIGGITGRIVALKDDSYVLETGPDRSKMKMAKWSIQTNLTVHDEEEKK